MLGKNILKLIIYTNVSGPVTTEELLKAEKYLIQSEQKQLFKKVFKSPRNNNSVENHLTLFNFVPFIDQSEIIRLGGKLEYGYIPTEEKFPTLTTRHN